MLTEDNLIDQHEKGKAAYKVMIRKALYRLKKATKTETAAEVKLPLATISKVFNELLQSGDIIELGVKDSSSGTKSRVYTLNNERVNLLSIIAENKKIEYMVTDLSGQVIDKRELSVQFDISYIQNVKKVVEDVLCYNKKIAAIALGVPGAVTTQGTVFAVPQIIQFEDVNLRRELEAEFHIPVIVQNDINTTALGYYSKGISFTLEEMVYIHVGGGLGAAIIIDGKVVSGFTNFAGEVAFMHVGERKKVEDLILNPRLKKKKEIYISKMLINIICLINPSVIVLGGVSEEEGMPERLLIECSKWIPENMLPRIRVISDERKCYFDGLVEIAAEKILEGQYESNRQIN